MSSYRRRSDDFVIFVVVGIIGAFILGVFIFDKIAEAKISKILEGENPSSELILALESKNPLMRENAEETLNEIGDPLLVTLSAICGGEAVDAKPYNPDSPGPHTLVFASGKLSHDWTYEFLEDYGPVSRNPEDVELMVCVSKGIERFGTCDYESGTNRARIQNLLSIDIYEASTGELIESIHLEGSEPRGCPPFMILSTSSPIRGSSIKEKDVREILERYYR